MIRQLFAVSIGWLGLSMLADGVPALLVPHQVLTTRGDASQLGFVTFTAIAIAALAQPFAGTWSDRTGAAPTITLGVVIAIGGLAALLVPLTLPGTILALLGVSVAQAGYQRLLPDRIAARGRGRGAGAKGLFDLGGAFLAFSILAGMLASGEVAQAATVMAAALAASLGLSLMLLGRRARLPARTPRADVVRSVPDRELVLIIVARFLFLLGVYTVGRFIVFFVADRLALTGGAAAGEAGLLLAVLALATGVAGLPAGWLADRIGRAPLMLAGGLVASAGIALLPLAGAMEAMLVPGILMAFGTAAFGAASWARVADLSAGEDSGRLMGIANFGTAGAAAAAGLFGPIVDAGNTASRGAGYGLAFAAAAAAAAVGGVLGWRASRGAYSHPALAQVPD